LKNQATGYASQHYLVPVPSQDKLGGLWQKGIQHKNWRMMEVGLLILASHPTDFRFYAGLIGSNNPHWLCVNPSSSSWV